jgi:hypothetical protein
MAFRNHVVKRNILFLLTVKLKFVSCNMLLGALREVDRLNLNGAHQLLLYADDVNLLGKNK